MCDLSLVGLYARPADGSALVSQMLFGETAVITQRKNKQWAKVSTTFDNIEAWVDLRQLSSLSADDYQKYASKFAVSLEVCQVLMNNDVSFPVLIASSLPLFDGMVFKSVSGKYVYNGQAAQFSNVQFSPEIMEKIARRFVNAPFVAGGRSVFGIDQTALVQLVYKCAGFQMPRTLPEITAVSMEIVHFVDLVQPGDIAFFVNKNDEICHLGLALSDGLILHVEEKVRIDKLDHEGIYNRDSRKYSYKLRYIARPDAIER